MIIQGGEAFRGYIFLRAAQSRRKFYHQNNITDTLMKCSSQRELSREKLLNTLMKESFNLVCHFGFIYPAYPSTLSQLVNVTLALGHFDACPFLPHMAKDSGCGFEIEFILLLRQKSDRRNQEELFSSRTSLYAITAELIQNRIEWNRIMISTDYFCSIFQTTYHP